MAVTFGFKLYVSVIGDANPILGVLGAAIVSLTWLYLLALTTLLGATLNAALIDRRPPLVDVAPRAAANGSATNGAAISRKPLTVTPPPTCGSRPDRTIRCATARISVSRSPRTRGHQPRRPALGGCAHRGRAAPPRHLVAVA